MCSIMEKTGLHIRVHMYMEFAVALFAEDI